MSMAGGYTWSKPLATDGCDNSPELRVVVPVQAGAKSKDCDVKIGKKSLRVGLKGKPPIVEGELWKEVDIEESSWEMGEENGQRSIILTLVKKSKWDKWDCLLRSEEKKVDTTITQRAFLDISIDGDAAGRLVLGLYGNIVPKTAENFAVLAAGRPVEGGAAENPVGYKGTTFHRIVPGYILQGGDTSFGGPSGGDSAFGGRFPDENVDLPHDKAGLLCMASSEKDMNGSQFFITAKAVPQLDGKHVVFGEVLAGYEEVVPRMEKVGSASGETSKVVLIEDCGLLP